MKKGKGAGKGRGSGGKAKEGRKEPKKVGFCYGRMGQLECQGCRSTCVFPAVWGNWDASAGKEGSDFSIIGS